MYMRELWARQFLPICTVAVDRYIFEVTRCFFLFFGSKQAFFCGFLMQTHTLAQVYFHVCMYVELFDFLYFADAFTLCTYIHTLCAPARLSSLHNVHMYVYFFSKTSWNMLHRNFTWTNWDFALTRRRWKRYIGLASSLSVVLNLEHYIQQWVGRRAVNTCGIGGPCCELAYLFFDSAIFSTCRSFSAKSNRRNPASYRIEIYTYLDLSPTRLTPTRLSPLLHTDSSLLVLWGYHFFWCTHTTYTYNA